MCAQTSASLAPTSLAEPSLPTRCVADAAESVLEIDPLTHDVSTFGVISSSVKRKWVEGVLARNGKIYAIVRSMPLEHTPTPAAAEPTPRMILGVPLAQPYDAPTILEIDPVTHSLETFGNVGREPCKWYGGVLAPNDKIYAIPYASQFVMEISPESKTAAIFATVGPGWGKWSGGVLAGNGMIYGIPALATSLLEIDVNSRTVTPYGMLPGGEQFEDKWNGGVLAPNGELSQTASRPLVCGAAVLYRVPPSPAQATSTASHGAAALSSNSIRRPRPSVSSGSSPQPTSPGELKPSISVRGAPARALPLTRALLWRQAWRCVHQQRPHHCACPRPDLQPGPSSRALPCMPLTPQPPTTLSTPGPHLALHRMPSLATRQAVPYNSAQILEIGERVCMPSDVKDDTTSTVLQPPPTISQSLSSMLMPVPMVAANVPTQTFILALPGCPDGNNGAPCRSHETASCRHWTSVSSPPHIHCASQKRASTTIAAPGTL